MHIHTFNLLLISSKFFFLTCSTPPFLILLLSPYLFSFFFLLTPRFHLFFISPIFTIYLLTYLFVYFLIHLYHYFFQFSCLLCFSFFLPFSLRNLQLHIYMWLITSDLSTTDTALICGLCQPHIYTNRALMYDTTFIPTPATAITTHNSQLYCYHTADSSTTKQLIHDNGRTEYISVEETIQIRMQEILNSNLHYVLTILTEAFIGLFLP